MIAPSPIASAPHDGTRVLVLVRTGAGWSFAGFARFERYPFASRHAAWLKEGPEAVEAREIRPTHWIPVTAPDAAA